jgi:hypothetical protein
MRENRIFGKRSNSKNVRPKRGILTGVMAQKNVFELSAGVGRRRTHLNRGL